MAVNKTGEPILQGRCKIFLAKSFVDLLIVCGSWLRAGGLCLQKQDYVRPEQLGRIIPSMTRFRWKFTLDFAFIEAARFRREQKADCVK